MRRVFVTGLAVLLATLFAGMPGPATARTQTMAGEAAWMLCPHGGRQTTGRLLNVRIGLEQDPVAGPRYIVRAEVDVVPCRQPAWHEVFAIAVYLQGAAGGNKTRYSEISGWTRAARPTGFAPEQAVEAVCLIVANDVRVDCVGVMGTRVTGRIPTDTPVCRQWARVSMTFDDPSPNCPSCW